ncbi:hypothetical protein [Parasitella parasitica]|uniref:Uncharacterized protein n=1 Tax=Parasitella parasitica TaxID=35722 RepID=A0A0B7NWD1_9FUNG|nr:hypothetical protein [Parasitella parasitica]
MVPDIESDGMIFGLTCFQMQNAKELSTVSSKLTTRELLLSPTVLHAEMIKFPGLKCFIKQIILKNAKGKLAVEDIVDTKKKMFMPKKTISQKLHHIRDTLSHKAKEAIEFNGEGFISLVAEEIMKRFFDIHILVVSLHKLFKHITYLTNYALFQYREKKGNVPLIKILQNCQHDLDKSKLESCLEGLDCGSLITKICSNPTMQMVLANTCNRVKKVLSRFNPVKNSPDGIHSIMLFDSGAFTKNEGEFLFYKHVLHTAFINENVAEIRNYNIPYIVFGNQISEGAMQKPFTMIRIVNSLLPPAMSDDDNSSNQKHNRKTPSKNEIDLFPPNSFHVHAQVKDASIKFILNKVVEVSLSDGVSKKSTFTTKEKEIQSESIVNAMCNLILGHSQMSEFEKDEKALLQCCSQHQMENGLYNGSYCYYYNNLKEVLDTWVQ